jgi:hypothetical protein
MHPLTTEFSRHAVCIAAAVISLVFPSFANAQAQAIERGKIQNWILANGDPVHAAIVNYSRQSRIITLELPNGKQVHVAPRDLTGASKFQWLTSDAFIQSLSGYKMPSQASLPLIRTFLGIFIGAVLGLLLAFWIAVSVLTGHRSVRRAIRAFSKITLCSLGIAITGLGLAWGIGNFFSHSSFETLLISIVYFVTLGLMLAITCRIVGREYEASEWVGIQTLVFVVFLFGVSSLVFFIGMPRALNQPGIDEWLTEQVLTPLELA